MSSTISKALKFIDNIIHLNDSAPIVEVLQIEGDITPKETALQIIHHFDSGKADLVVSHGAPDVTGMHDIDKYTQGQLNFTELVSREGGKFVAKIVCGRDISLLYQKLQIFF